MDALGNLAPAAILAILPLFAACGGEGADEAKTEYELIDNSSNYGTCTSWIDYYDDPANCGNSGSSGGSAGSGSGSPDAADRNREHNTAAIGLGYCRFDQR